MNLDDVLDKFKFAKALPKQLSKRNSSNSDNELASSQNSNPINSSLAHITENNRRKQVSSQSNQTSAEKSEGQDEAIEEFQPKSKKTKQTAEKKKKVVEKPKKENKSGSDQKNSQATKSQEKPSADSKIYAHEENQITEESLQDIFTRFDIPEWLKEGNIRDKNMKKPGEEGYDPTTLYIPPEAKKNMTLSMKQYWEVKQNHFDKLVAYCMFEKYWFYYYDAIVTSKILDIKIGVFLEHIMQTFFHHNRLLEYAPKLLQNGHKIVIVDNMTDKNELHQNLDKIRKGEIVMRREVSQIITRGTFVDDIEFGYDSRYTLCVFENNLNYGLVFVDTTTHEFFIGEFQDSSERAHFRTLMTRTKPVEVVYYKEYLTVDTLSIIKGMSNKPNLTPFSILNLRETTDIFIKIKHYLKGPSKFLQEIENKTCGMQLDKNDQNFMLIQALYLCLEFMESVLLAHTVFGMGNFLPFDGSFQRQGTLYLDSQALESLEILEVPYFNSMSESASLLGYMNKTSSAFGKRLFKRWLTAPLLDSMLLAERQKAVDDFLHNFIIVDQFQAMLKKLPDLERMINKFYNLADKQKLMVVHSGNSTLNKLKDFFELLKQLKFVELEMEKIQNYASIFKSKRLRQLCSFRKSPGFSSQIMDEDDGLFPRVYDIASDFEKMIKIRDNNIIPSSGINQEVDSMMLTIKDIKNKLQNILMAQRKYFHCDEIQYVNSRQKYELEIPIDLVEGPRKPENFISTSKRQGYLRFHTPEIQDLVSQLTPIEYELQRAMIPMVIDYFIKFYEKNTYWRQMIACLAELDCLCSLAGLAREMKVSSKPEVLPVDYEQCFELKDMIHPMAAKNKPNFIPNSLMMKDPIFLITGPNMGGKSTLLRMSCIAVIMAQMGSYVPAESFRFRAVDRIFTRIGATDRIFEGKSTFYVEMEETYHIATQATQNSLLVVDELGRGTSTYDGVSIAYATLKYIAERINCITLFATHYHLLLEEFEIYKNIRTYYMLSEFDEEKEEVKFKYKFVEGKANKSHGIIIAKMAGLPEGVIYCAKQKEKLMTKEKKTLNLEKNLTGTFNTFIDRLEKLDLNEEQSEEDKIISDILHLF